MVGVEEVRTWLRLFDVCVSLMKVLRREGEVLSINKGKKIITNVERYAASY